MIIGYLDPWGTCFALGVLGLAELGVLASE